MSYLTHIGAIDTPHGKMGARNGLGMVHRALKLQHHQHTAKRLPHAHTSYRGLFVVLALAALCFGLIQNVRADDYTVSATVPSADLNQPAVITSPANGTVVNASTVEVKGTCQVVIGGTVVVLERDGENLGSQTCPSDGKFAITITLLEGENRILPKVFTTANVPGPDGSLVTIIRPVTPLAPGSGGATGTRRATGTGGVQPLKISPDGAFVVYNAGEPARLTLSLEGGTAPYRLYINWGDQSGLQEWTIESSGTRSFEHMYKVNNAYSIEILLEDARGERYDLQVTAVGLAVPALSLAAPAEPFAGLRAWFASPLTRIVWGGYALVSVVTIALWWASPNHTLLWQGVAPGRSLLKRRN